MNFIDMNLEISQKEKIYLKCGVQPYVNFLHIFIYRHYIFVITGIIFKNIYSLLVVNKFENDNNAIIKRNF